MHAQSETALIEFQDWTLRVRAATQQPSRLFLLVHGWTGDENSMWVFARNLGGRYWIVAPRALYVTEPSGYSWQPTKHQAHERPTLANLRPAIPELLTMIDKYAADNGIDAAEFDAIGFSQGAALISSLALMHPERVGRVGILAGFVPAGAEELAGSRPLQGKPFFVAHGTLDERVDVRVARESVKVLEQAGAQVTYCEDEVGHKLSARCLRSLEEFFR